MYADMVDNTLEQRLDTEISQLNDQKETKNLADGEADDDLAVPACTGGGSSRSYLVGLIGQLSHPLPTFSHGRST